MPKQGTRLQDRRGLPKDYVFGSDGESGTISRISQMGLPRKYGWNMKVESCKIWQALDRVALFLKGEWVSAIARVGSVRDMRQPDAYLAVQSAIRTAEKIMELFSLR